MKAFVSLMGALLLLAACATTQIDWNSRVGHYSYDEAVTELGVPDRSATLSDGTTVCEWLTARGTGYGTFHYFPGSRLQTYDVSQFPDRYLRLVFGPDKRLAKAEKFSR